jgi:hypothetical protein
VSLSKCCFDFCAMILTIGVFRINLSSSDVAEVDVTTMESSETGPCKQPWTSASSTSYGTGSTSLLNISTSSFFSSRKRAKKDHSPNQMMLCKLKDPEAPALMDVAVADFLHSHCLPFSLADDKKLMRVIEVACNLGPNYKAPSHQDIGGKYLDALY